MDLRVGKDKSKNVAGQRFSRWVVLERAGRRGRMALWRCRCDCGTERGVTTGALTSGESTSCGCRRFDSTATLNGVTSKHPLTYLSWSRMIARCTQPGNNRFESYAGRGIGVCDRWLSFENFLADMGECPGPGWTIERRDNDGNYEPANCRWLRKELQARNRRTTRWVTVRGVTASLAEHAERCGVNYKWAWRQIVALGRVPEAVFSGSVIGPSDYH